MSNKLHLMMGIPGAGKSTFVMSHLDEHSVWISRDDVRFSMVAEDEGYFSKEKQVFKEFVRRINNALENGYNVFADATHITKASRNKLLTAINPELKIEVDVIWIKTSPYECIRRNNNRRGTRSFVHEDVIDGMYHNIETPEFEEGFDTIYIVESNKPIQILKEIS